MVLYFFPKAFTQGCTIEANAFAEATPRFAALGATVVGLSHDDIDTLRKSPVEECRDRFAVASDPQARTIKAYDASSLLPGMASRILRDRARRPHRLHARGQQPAGARGRNAEGRAAAGTGAPLRRPASS